MYSLNDNLLSKASPRWFWFEPSLISKFLKKSGGCLAAFFFPEKIISCACLVRSGLNGILNWYAKSCIFNWSLFSAEVEVFTQFTMLNKEVSSAKSFTSEFSPSDRSLYKWEKTVVPILTLVVRQLLFISNWINSFTYWDNKVIICVNNQIDNAHQ